MWFIQRKFDFVRWHCSVFSRCNLGRCFATCLLGLGICLCRSWFTVACLCLHGLIVGCWLGWLLAVCGWLAGFTKAALLWPLCSRLFLLWLGFCSCQLKLCQLSGLQFFSTLMLRLFLLKSCKRSPHWVGNHEKRVDGVKSFWNVMFSAVMKEEMEQIYWKCGTWT